jgi:hypothetical protein
MLPLIEFNFRQQLRRVMHQIGYHPLPSRNAAQTVHKQSHRLITLNSCTPFPPLSHNPFVISLIMASVQPPNPLPPDQNVGPILLGISGTCLALVIITTSVRIWVRSALRSSGWDDYTIVIVTLLGIARFGVQVGQVSIGNGRHRWFIEPEDYVQNNKLGWVAQILLFASICLLKISILLLLLRIKDSKKVRYAAWGIMAGLVVTNFGCIIILLSECRPVSAYWTGVGECWNPRIRIYYIYATIGMKQWPFFVCRIIG